MLTRVRAHMGSFLEACVGLPQTLRMLDALETAFRVQGVGEDVIRGMVKKEDGYRFFVVRSKVMKSMTEEHWEVYRGLRAAAGLAEV